MTDSLHYFPSKTDLAVEVIRRYKDTFNTYLSKIAAEKKSWIDKLRDYIALYSHVLHDHKICLCGMLASDIETLPSKLKKEIRLFFSDNVAWLTMLLSEFYTLPKKRLTQIAWHLISTLQGGVIMARMLGKPVIFSSISEELIHSVSSVV